MKQTKRQTLTTLGGMVIAGSAFGTGTVSAADPTVEVDTSCEMISLENDVEDPSTITIDGPTYWEKTLGAGEKRDVPVDPGEYTITATSEGLPMRVNDQDSLTVDIPSCQADAPDAGDEVPTVSTETACGEIGLENGYAEAVTVEIEEPDGQETSTQASMDLPPGGGSDVPAEKGTYTLTAKNDAGNPKTVDGEEEVTVKVPCAVPGEPQTILADGGCGEISFGNAAGVTVEITVEGPPGTKSIELAHMGDLGYPTEPGKYTVTAETTGEDPKSVTVNQEETATILVVECPKEEVNIDARSYDCEVLEVENENGDIEVTVHVYQNGGKVDEIDLGPDERKRVDGFEPETTYTLEAEAERSATVNGKESDEITMQEC